MLDCTAYNNITSDGYCLGNHTLLVPNALFAENRRRLCERLKKNPNLPANSFVVLQGGDSVPLYDTDVEYNYFRQEPYFHWMFGVKEPGCYGIVDINTGNSHLFVPELPSEYAVWMGRLHTLDDFKAMYNVDEVHYVTKIRDVVKKLNPGTLLTLVQLQD